MVLLLETADVLEARARRGTDPAQAAVLLRRAEQRRQKAAQLRERLAARGAVLARPQTRGAPVDTGLVSPPGERPSRPGRAPSPCRTPERMAESGL